MSKKQYIAAGVVAVCLIASLYVVPALAMLDSLFPALIVGIAGLTVMAAAVFKGGLTDVSGE